MVNIKNIEEAASVSELKAFIAIQARLNYSEQKGKTREDPFSQRIFYPNHLGVSYASGQNYESTISAVTPSVPIFLKMCWLAGYSADEVGFKLLQLQGDTMFQVKFEKNDIKTLINRLSPQTSKDDLLLLIQRATRLLMESEKQTDEEDDLDGLELSSTERITNRKHNKPKSKDNERKLTKV